ATVPIAAVTFWLSTSLYFWIVASSWASALSRLYWALSTAALAELRSAMVGFVASTWLRCAWAVATPARPAATLACAWAVAVTWEAARSCWFWGWTLSRRLFWAFSSAVIAFWTVTWAAARSRSFAGRTFSTRFRWAFW